MGFSLVGWHPPPLQQAPATAQRLSPPFALARPHSIAFWRGFHPPARPRHEPFCIVAFGCWLLHVPAPAFSLLPLTPPAGSAGSSADSPTTPSRRLPADDSQPTTPSRRLPSASPPQPAGFPPLPPSPPTPRGRGGVKFAPTSLSQGGRCLIVSPPQSVRSNEVVNVPPFIGHGRKPKFVFLVKSK